MSIRRVVLTLSLSLCTANAMAEVAAILDVNGVFEQVQLRMDPPNVVWAEVSTLSDNLVLNPLGDRAGDQVPACGILSMPMDDPARDHFIGIEGPPPADSGDPILMPSSLAVWPHREGADYRLVYSLWDPIQFAWTRTMPVASTNNRGLDLRPWLHITPERVYVAWRGDSGVFFVIGRVVVDHNVPRMEWGTPLPLQWGALLDGVDVWRVPFDIGDPGGTGDRGR